MSESNKKYGEEPAAKDARDETERQVGEDSVIEQLQRQIAAKELEAKQNYERLLRQAAELDNFKKRSAKEKEEAIRYANENLIKDLLPILDNLERAVSYAQGGGNGKSVREGVEMVLKNFLEVLERHGVTPIPAKGEPFDPQKHEAIAQVETKTHAPNSVVEEHHKGYFLLDRLLRPALVTTARPLEGKEKNRRPEELENDESDD